MERYALGLAESFKNLGHAVVFHAHRADPAMAESLGIELRLAKVRRFPRKLQDFRFFRKVEQARRQADGWQIALTRVRVNDLVICGGTHRGYLSRARKLAGPFDWLQIWMEQEGYRYARAVISHSNLCTGELTRLYGVPAGKIVTLFPPVDASFMPPADDLARAEGRRKLGFPDGKVVFLFPSMGHRRKGLDRIYRALSSLSDNLILAVAGKPPGGLNRPWIQYLGYVQDMTEAYRAADFTILGSSYEPFGLVGPESVLCGTRLVFEENIGCLAAIKPEAVFTFSARDLETIRQAASRAIAMARQNRHRLSRPAEALVYNPSGVEHARALSDVLAA